MPTSRESAIHSNQPHLPRDETPDIDPFSGRVLGGRFALVSPQPGTRRSYLAYDALDGRIVEVIIEEPSELSRLRALVQASAAVDHPHIVSYIAWGVHSAGLDSIVAYVVCEFIPSAVTLQQYRLQRGPLDADELEDVMETIAQALDACREQGVALGPVSLDDIVITSLPGWPRVVKLRAVPAEACDAWALQREDVRELELPVDEEPPTSPGAIGHYHARLVEIAEKLR